jgi:hypothetical protein
LAESDNDEEGFREAKLALKENPKDPLAHRSAGIALRSERNYPETSAGSLGENLRSPVSNALRPFAEPRYVGAPAE